MTEQEQSGVRSLLRLSKTAPFPHEFQSFKHLTQSKLPTGTTLVSHRICQKGDYLLCFTITTVAWYKVRGFIYQWRRARSIGKLGDIDITLVEENKLEGRNVEVFYEENFKDLDKAIRVVQGMVERQGVEAQWVGKVGFEDNGERILANPTEDYLDSAYDIWKVAKQIFGDVKVRNSSLCLTNTGQFYFELLMEVNCIGRDYQIHCIQRNKRFKFRVYDLKDPGLHLFLDPNQLTLTQPQLLHKLKSFHSLFHCRQSFHLQIAQPNHLSLSPQLIQPYLIGLWSNSHYRIVLYAQPQGIKMVMSYSIDGLSMHGITENYETEEALKVSVRKIMNVLEREIPDGRKLVRKIVGKERIRRMKAKCDRENLVWVFQSFQVLGVCFPLLVELCFDLHSYQYRLRSVLGVWKSADLNYIAEYLIETLAVYNVICEKILPFPIDTLESQYIEWEDSPDARAVSNSLRKYDLLYLPYESHYMVGLYLQNNQVLNMQIIKSGTQKSCQMVIQSFTKFVKSTNCVLSIRSTKPLQPNQLETISQSISKCPRKFTSHLLQNNCEHIINSIRWGLNTSFQLEFLRQVITIMKQQYNSKVFDEILLKYTTTTTNTVSPAKAHSIRIELMQTLSEVCMFSEDGSVAGRENMICRVLEGILEM